MTGWANWLSFKKDRISSRLDPSPGQRWGGGFCSPQITVFLWGRPAVPGTSCQNSTQGSQIPALFPPHLPLLDKPCGLWTVSRLQKRGLKPDWERTSGTAQGLSSQRWAWAIPSQAEYEAGVWGDAETRAEAAGFGQILGLFIHSLFKRCLPGAQPGAWCGTPMCPRIHRCRVPAVCQAPRMLP